MATYTKDPDAVLDYVWDWTAWLGQGETITDAQMLVPDGLTLSDVAHTGTTVTAWLSAGTPGGNRVTCRVTTNQGRTDDRSITVYVTDR